MVWVSLTKLNVLHTWNKDAKEQKPIVRNRQTLCSFQQGSLDVIPFRGKNFIIIINCTPEKWLDLTLYLMTIFTNKIISSLIVEKQNANN